jgi:hypothetical protein
MVDAESAAGSGIAGAFVPTGVDGVSSSSLRNLSRMAWIAALASYRPFARGEIA